MNEIVPTSPVAAKTELAGNSYITVSAAITKATVFLNNLLNISVFYLLKIITEHKKSPHI